MRARILVALAGVVALTALTSCSSDSSGSPAASAGVTSGPVSTDRPSGPASSTPLFPDVIAATATRSDDGTWEFAATLSSPYDSAERYADAWRVLAPDGTELGVRELLHDHAGEQPFTRSLAGVDVPEGVDTVTIEGRDQVNGWGGATVDVVLQP